MDPVVISIGKSVRDLFDGKILMLFFIPALISFLIWAVIFVIFAGAWLASLSGAMLEISLVQWIQGWLDMSLVVVTQVLAVIILFLMFVPSTYLTTVLIVSIFAMPVIVKHIHQKYYPEIQPTGTAQVASVINTLWHSLRFVIFLVLSLPLWLIPGMQILIPLLLTAALNRRIFAFDALADYRSREEIQKIQESSSKEFFGLGLVMGVFSYIPFINFLVPVFSGLAYTHLCFQKLKSPL